MIKNNHSVSKKSQTKINSIFLSLCLGIIIIIAPSNLFYKFLESSSYVNGLKIDYLIPKIFTSDIVISIFTFFALFITRNEVILSLKSKLKDKKIIFLALAIMLFAISNFIVSENKVANIWYQLKLAQMLLFLFAILKSKTAIIKKIIFISLFTSLLIQLAFASYQFINQKSFADYYFFGETNLRNYANISKGFYINQQKILAYGTTAHPNILAGFSTLISLLLISFSTQFSPNLKKKLLVLVAIIINLGFLYLTQSSSAVLAFLIGLILLANTRIIQKLTSKKKTKTILILSMMIVFWIIPFFIKASAIEQPKNPSLFRRDYLNDSAWRIFLDRPFVGVGLNNFTTQVERFSPNREVVRFVQPAHHVGLLLLAEAGFLGLIIISLLFSYLPKSDGIFSILLILMPIASLDHYLITQQLGLIMLVLIFSFGINPRKDK